MVLLATPAVAQDAPLRGPAPAWVEDFEAPRSGSATPSPSGLQLHLLDQQLHFDENGSHAYMRMIYTVTAPQGLSQGTFFLIWNPAFQTVTVSEASILRGDETIDVLADQTFEIIRREENLGNAMLTGVLTAVLQPRGLRVGDTIVFSYTLTTQDPSLAGHNEFLATVVFPMPAERFRLQASWPEGAGIRVRGNDPVETPAVRREGNLWRVEYDRRDVQPVLVPTDVPARYHHFGQIEFSDYSSWGQISTLMAPLYETATILEPGSPIMAEVEAIRAAGGTQAEMAAAALRLVQDEIRYVAIVMGAGGLVPVSADETWRNRYGDCKAKTALLIAILRELGIESQPALVSSTFGDGLDQRLPMIALFDHVIVRAVIDGEVYWLDGTRSGDRSLKDASSHPFVWALPVSRAGHELEAMPQHPLEMPLYDRIVRIDASAGLYAPALIEAETIMRGPLAAEMNLMLASAPEADRKFLAESLYMTLGSFEDPEITIDFDEETAELRIGLKGQTNLSWRVGTDGRSELSLFESRVTLDLSTVRSEGPFASLPVAIGHPNYFRAIVTVILPDGGEGFDLVPEDLDLVLAGHQIIRNSRMESGVVTTEALIRSLQSEIPLEQAKADMDAWRPIRNSQVRIQAPQGYRPTEGDRLLVVDSGTQTASQNINRGLVFLNSGEYDLAIEAFDRAIALEPENANAHANRGIAKFHAGRIEEAEVDIERALDLDPSETVGMNGRGLLAIEAGDYEEAVIAFSRSIRYASDKTWALWQRALAYVALEQYDKALADLDALLAIRPGNQATLQVKATVLDMAGRPEEAIALIDAALAEAPEDRALLATLADLHLAHGDPALTVEAMNTALLQEEDNALFLLLRGRAYYRLGDVDNGASDIAAARAIAADDPQILNSICWELALDNVDLDGALADCDAALALMPEGAHIMDSRAMVLLRLGRFEEAVTQYDAALAIAPSLAPSLYGRGMAKRGLGMQDEGQVDIDAALELSPEVRDSFESVRTVALPDPEENTTP